MKMMSKAQPPRELLDRVESLQTTAEYIEALANVVSNQIDALRASMRDPAFVGVSMSEVGDWNEMYTILSLLRSQSHIVRDTCLAVEDVRMAVAA